MAFVRAAERVNLQRVRQCASAYPHISSYCNPEDPNARCSQGFQQLKRHIVELSRESIAEDLEDTAREEDWTLKRQKKENVLKKMKRLLPGCATTMSAVQRESGEIVDTAKDMAEVLRSHWQKVFERKAHGSGNLRTGVMCSSKKRAGMQGADLGWTIFRRPGKMVFARTTSLCKESGE